jgi:UDP-3-O-[3-hydroxymyristoyl] glucosamine N-acyltransferase
MKEKSLAELANMVGGEISGDAGVIIHNLMDVDLSCEGEITFITSSRNAHKISTTNASAVIVPLDVASFDKPLIRTKNPNLAAAIIHSYFCATPYDPKGVHATAHVGIDCEIPKDITIGPNAVLGDRVKLGERVTIGPGVVVGDDVVIGDDTLLHPNVTVAYGCKIGSRVILQSGAVVGGDGFGYATDEKGFHIKRPQIGIVEIEDDVEIGANTTIDRATFGRTLIKRGVKIDNLVQVAHNVEIGEGSIMAGQAGIAGSAILGKGVVLGGQVAVKDHVCVGDRAMAAGKSGVISNIAAGEVVSGMPAIPHKKWLRASAIFAKLPDLVKEIHELRKKVSELSDKLKTSNK